MAKTAVELMAEKVARLERQVKNLSSQPRLSNASIEDTSVPLRDRSGRTRATLGRQPDGSHGSRVVESPPQPVPSAPVLRAGKAGVVMVRWDGNADGPVPLIHGHVEVVASGPSSPAEVVSTIRDRAGGATSFVADEAGTWSVHLVMVGQDRVTRSEPSAVSTVEVSLPVDGDAIQAEIDQAKQDLADAEAEWEQARQGLRSDLDTLNDTTLPALESDLSENSTAISAAEARLDQAETDLSTAQQNVDAIQNTTIPAVEQNLSDAEAAWEQSKTDLQSGLDQINNETIPQVRTDAQQWADDAEAAAIAQAAQDAQAEYDRLQELAERALRRTSNLIHDGSFETNWYQQAWSADDLAVSTVEHGSVDATEGVRIVRVDTSGGLLHGSLNFTPESYAGDTPTNNFRDLSMPVEPGQIWRFTMDARATNSSFSGTMRIRCNVGGSVTTIEQLEFTPTLDWETYTLDVTIPQGVTEVYWMWRPSISGGGFFADRVSARDITDIKVALDKAEAAAQAAQDAHTAAGEAKTQADTAMTRAGQVGARLGGDTPPVGTAPENSLWFQWSDLDDPNRTVLGVWQMIDGNWTEQDSSDPALIPTVDIGAATVGTLKAVRIDVASLYADTAFVNNLHAETVEAMRVTAETGFIGGVHLADNSVGARQVIASEVGAEVGTFVEIDAGQVTTGLLTSAQIDVQELAAQTAAIIELDADRITTGQLGAARIDVQQLMAQSAVIDTIHAETVEAMKVTGEVGFIGGVLLENGAVTLDKMTVTESMTAAIAEFLEVKAVHIDFNSMVGSSAFIAEMEASNVKLASEVTNRRFEVSGEGWVLTDTSTGETLAKVGSDGTAMMKNADIQGRLQTTYSAGAGLTIDRGDFDYYSLRTGSYLTATNAPYIRLSNGSGSTAEQPIITADGTDLVISSGRDASGGDRPINLDGRVLANSGVYSADLRARQYEARNYPFNMNMNAVQLRFTDESNNRVTGIGHLGSRTHIWGELPASQSQDHTILHCRSGQETLAAGSHMRGTYTYGSPARSGSRWPMASGLVTPSGSGGYLDFRTVTVSAAVSLASGFRWTAAAPSTNSGPVVFYVVAQVIWGGE